METNSAAALADSAVGPQKNNILTPMLLSLRSKGDFESLCEDLNNFNYQAIPEFIELTINREFSARTAQIFRRLWSQFFKVKGRNANRSVRLNIKAIANELCCCEKTIRRSVSELFNAEAIILQRETGKNGQDQMSTFTISSDFFKEARKGERKRSKPVASVDGENGANTGNSPSTSNTPPTNEQPPEVGSNNTSEGRDTDAKTLQLKNKILLLEKEILAAEAQAPKFREDKGLDNFHKESAAHAALLVNLKGAMRKAEKALDELNSTNQAENASAERSFEPIWEMPTNAHWRIRGAVKLLATKIVITNKAELAKSIYEWMTDGWGKSKTNDFNHALNVAIKLCEQNRWSRTVGH